MNKNTIQCDAIIAWVDGDDPKHKKKRLQAMQDLGLTDGVSDGEIKSSNFAHRGEIYYCIASILKYAAFVRRIYIVTDGQRPELIDEFAKQGVCDADKIKIIDHKELFKGHESVLPTFNSLTIETMLWNIQGLSDYCIYFNDDFFLNSEVSARAFVGENGQLILRGRMRSIWPVIVKKYIRDFKYKMLSRGKPAPSRFNVAQALSAHLLGLNHYIQIGHTPHVMRRNTMKAFLTQHPDLLHAQISPKFRTAGQFLPVGLANHLEMRDKNVEFKPPAECVYIKPNTLNNEMIKEIEMSKVAFACVQNLDEFSDPWGDRMRKVLIKKFEGFLPDTIVKYLES